MDTRKENILIDKICDDLGMPRTEYAPMEVAANYLNVSVRQARHLCYLGHLGQKYGHRTWIITRDELIQFKPNKPPIGRPTQKSER